MGPYYHDLHSVADGPEGLLILMYHSIAVPPLFHGLRGLHLPPRTLRAQLLEFKTAGIPFTTLDELDSAPPPRQVALTFDDGFRNNHRHALPILHELGLCALVYLPAGMIGTTNSWDAARPARILPLMNATELREWCAAGQQVGSHGLTHIDLTLLPETEARREIVESKARLEDLLQREIVQFCYPYGAWNSRIRDLVQEAGYKSATTTTPGINAPGCDRYALKRVMSMSRRPILTAVTGGLAK